MAMGEIAAIELKLIDNVYIMISWGILDLHMDPSTSGQFGHPYYGCNGFGKNGHATNQIEEFSLQALIPA